jgi:hypothetical protein
VGLYFDIAILHAQYLLKEMERFLGFTATDIQLFFFFMLHQESTRKLGETGIKWSASGLGPF